MLEKGLTFSDIADAIRRKRGTVHNALSDPSKNTKTRQAITNFIGVQIFPGIAVTEHRFTAPIGMEIIGWSIDEAKKTEAELSGFVKRKGGKIRFIKALELVWYTPDLSLEISKEERQP
jgi:hypothetical protein